MARGLKVLGLTGGIGSGKSTVAGMFADLGVPVLDADVLAREAVEPGAPALADVAAAWPEVVGPGGRLDRKRLGAIVFANPAARRRLEAILHPRIAELAERRFADLARAGHRLAVYEASLLVETSRHRDFDGLVVVTCSPATQLARVLARGGLTEAEAKARIAAQLPLAAKVAEATYVIDNDGDLERTRAQVATLVASLRPLDSPGESEGTSLTSVTQSRNLSTLNPQALFDSQDLSWLQKPDREVEGTFVERKEWANADELRRQISALANGNPPGGLLVVGVTKSGEIKGVDARRPALEEALADLNKTIDAHPWTIRWVDKPKTVLFLYVPFSSNRVICLSSGRAYRRLGESTIELSPDQIAELRYARGERDFESEPAAPFTSELLDPQQEKAFIDGVVRRNGLTLPTTTRDALLNKGLIDKRSEALTFAGIVALGQNPVAFLPGARLRFLRFEGTSETFGTHRNVVKDAWFDGPIPRLIADLRSFLKGVVREFDYLGSDGKFVREPEYPEFALDEAIVNALVHRSYSLKNVAVFVRMFDDRIEIESPGIFPRNARPNAEGVFPFSAPRNPVLAQALQYLEIVRLAREGTQRMHQEMEAMGLPPPRFSEVEYAKVVVTLFNDFERRRARVGTDDIRQKWIDIGRLLMSDLAIERRRAVEAWEVLTRSGAIPPAEILDAAVQQIRSPAMRNDEKSRVLRVLAPQPPDAIRMVAERLASAMTTGLPAMSSDVLSLIAGIIARDDSALESAISWLERFSLVTLGIASETLEITFQAIVARVHREPFPDRSWLDRVTKLAVAHRSSADARSAYALITGRDIKTD